MARVIDDDGHERRPGRYGFGQELDRLGDRSGTA